MQVEPSYLETHPAVQTAIAVIVGLVFIWAICYVLFWRKDRFTDYAERYGEDKTKLTPGEEEVIEACAMGHAESKLEAIDIYRANLGKVQPKTSLHMRYMAEVDTPVPDLALRADLRDQLHRLIERRKAHA